MSRLAVSLLFALVALAPAALAADRAFTCSYSLTATTCTFAAQSDDAALGILIRDNTVPTAVAGGWTALRGDGSTAGSGSFCRSTSIDFSGMPGVTSVRISVATGSNAASGVGCSPGGVGTNGVVVATFRAR